MSNESLPARYHPVHVALHWLIAIMVIGAIAIGMLYLDSPNTPEKIPYLQLHTVWGFVLFALMGARLITRFALKRPAPATTGNAFLDRVAGIVHLLLYILVLGMLVSGLGMSAQANLMAVYQGQAALPDDFRVFPPRIGHGLTYSILFIVTCCMWARRCTTSLSAGIICSAGCGLEKDESPAPGPALGVFV